MRLYLNKKDSKGKREFLDVGMWSFIKCTLITSLVFMAAIWVTIAILMGILLITGMALGWSM